MTPFFRAIGTAFLVTAMLHATAGICLCHSLSGPAGTPGSAPGGHPCCHPVAPPDTLALRAIPTCCHIEAAQRDMTPMDAVHLGPPVTVAVAMPDARSCAAGQSVQPRAVDTSPPVRILRI